MTFDVAAFYKFVPVADPREFCGALRSFGQPLDLVGTILVAPEGINGTIGGSKVSIEAILAHLRNDERFADLEVKRSHCDVKPFKRLRVRLKREIVTFGVPVDPVNKAGTYVDAAAWNDLIADPDVVLIDTRNVYEVAVGTFPGAIDPGTRSFGEFAAFARANRGAFEGKRIAMFCTGGIRCEKASAYMRELGLPDVHHLQGGILRYLETVPPEESRWTGECFVFDKRVALTHGVAPGATELCFACGMPFTAKVACACPSDDAALTEPRSSAA